MTRPRLVAAAVAVAAVALAVNYLRPVPAVEASQVGIPVQTGGGTPAAVPWPASAQSAVGAEGAGVLAATPNAKPQPIASVAKVMTALVTLGAKPLTLGDRGPTITVTADDVATYQQESANGESVVQVEDGEQLSEFQALQGLLIPSGNNFASLLAKWAFGSVDSAVQKMNSKAVDLNLKQTKFADASGVSDQTVSVPADLIRLGQAAMKDPVFAYIVGEAEVTLPVAGRIPNVNGALGQDGIVGIKTGDTPRAGAVYLTAAQHKLASGRSLLIFAAVQGLPTRDLAFTSARGLLAAVGANLQSRRLVSANQVVGRYTAAWGSQSDVLSTQDVDLLTWPGQVVRSELRAKALDPPIQSGAQVGDLHVIAGGQAYDVPVATSARIDPPGSPWRLIRIG